MNELEKKYSPQVIREVLKQLQADKKAALTQWNIERLAKKLIKKRRI